MSKVLLVSNNPEIAKDFQEILQKNSHEFIYADSMLMTIDIMKTQLPDIVLLDSKTENIDIKSISNRIKSFDNVLTILLVWEEKISPELIKNANAFLQMPVSETLLLSTINANLKTKSALDKLSNSNQELARSLYQLNVLYSTSSQFAGTLDKDKLINIMIDGIDKSLSFGLSCVLTFKNENEPLLIINSLYNISERLLEALKLRATLNYNSLFEKKKMPFELDIQTLKVEKHIKYSIKEYDFSVLRSDNMFAPIVLSDNFYGFIEIFREAEFTTEDTTCFQTLAQQVSLPLKSASLYEEIKKNNQKLERLERLKSEFISIVSHELRTPLTAIKNSMDIILSGKTGTLTDTMAKFMDMGRRNVARLSAIINDLLDLSKIEAGKMDFKFEIMKIEPVIEYVKSSLEEMAKEKNLNLVTKIDDNFIDIYADSRRLEQVLTNLVSNAIKFTPENAKIEIRTQVIDAKDIHPVENFKKEQEALEGKYLQICVKDGGIGIENMNLAHVFDKFAQIENSLSRKVGGSGLGLSIARQLLEAHNGTIWCNSKPNKGSSFYFVLPIASKETKFRLDFKQNLQKAKVNNSTLALMMVKSDENFINSIKSRVINDTYLNNSYEYSENGITTLTMSVPDGDKALAEFIKEEIRTYANKTSLDDESYDIMFAYGIYPRDALDDVDLLEKTEESFSNLKKISVGI